MKRGDTLLTEKCAIRVGMTTYVRDRVGGRGSRKWARGVCCLRRVAWETCRQDPSSRCFDATNAGAPRISARRDDAEPSAPWRDRTPRRSLTRSLPLARPSRASGFGQIAGGLLHSRSVGLAAFAIRKSFSPLPKWLKSQAAQVPKLRYKFGTRLGCLSYLR